MYYKLKFNAIVFDKTNLKRFVVKFSFNSDSIDSSSFRDNALIWRVEGWTYNIIRVQV